MGVVIHSQPEDLDVTFLEGNPSYPLVVFIHGLGMDRNIWSDPGRSKIMAGSFPLTVLLGKKPRTRTYRNSPSHYRKITLGTPPKKFPLLFENLNARGFPVLCWSQKRPIAPADIPLRELETLIDRYKRFSKKGLVLIGHSRGGLVAWEYALHNPRNIKAVVTIGSPFHGSTLAQWAKLVSRFTGVLGPLLPKTEGGKVRNSIKRIKDFIESRAVKELLPGSPFLDNLKNPLKSNIKNLCIAGSNPNFFSIYKWRKSCIKDHMRNPLKYKLIPSAIFSVPDSLGGMLPDELVKGKGDGLVSASSALHQQCHRSSVLPLNHVQLLFSTCVNTIVTDLISEAVGT